MIIPNIDTLIVNVRLEHYEYHMKDLFALLEEKKKKAAENMQKYNSCHELVEINSITFEVLPNGSRGHAYILSGEMIKIEVARYARADRYPLRITFRSEYLWSAGPKQAWQEIALWLSALGPIAQTQISRVDLCAHTDEIDWNNKLSCFKGRQTTDCLHREHKQITGYSFGSRDSKIYTRIYNKNLEITKSRKDWFEEIWNRNGRLGRDVWNVEFELHRDYFREVEIETVEDLFESLTSIWTYLTESYLVLTNRDRSRLKRSTTHQGWIALQSAFDKFGGFSYIERKKVIKAQADSLIPQMAGTITSYIARQGSGIIDIEDIITELAVTIPKHYKEKHQKELEDVMYEKYLKLQEEFSGENITSIDRIS